MHMLIVFVSFKFKSKIECKWVAKIPLHFTSSKHSSIAAANAAPALGSVPLPSSSRRTKLRCVASSSTYLISVISTANADRPSKGESEAKFLSMKASKYGTLVVGAAGTAKPQAASNATAAVERRIVDLPAILGPVRRTIPYKT